MWNKNAFANEFELYYYSFHISRDTNRHDSNLFYKISKLKFRSHKNANGSFKFSVKFIIELKQELS